MHVHANERLLGCPPKWYGEHGYTCPPAVINADGNLASWTNCQSGESLTAAGTCVAAGAVSVHPKYHDNPVTMVGCWATGLILGVIVGWMLRDRRK